MVYLLPFRANIRLQMYAFAINNLVESGKNLSCADPEIFMRGGPTKMVIFGHRRGGGEGPEKSRNYLF